MSAVQGGYENSGNYYFGKYFGGNFGPVSDFNKVVNYVQSNLAGDVDGEATAAAMYPNNFHTVERITAGYAMNTLDFGKLRVQTGVRFEGTQMNIDGYFVTLYPAQPKVPIYPCTSPNNTGCGVGTPTSSNPSYLDVLPSMQLRYSLPHDSALRAVYSRGVSRPVPYQMVPYVTENQDASPVALNIGNPSLKPTHSNNYDLLYEKFLRPLGMLQVGGLLQAVERGRSHHFDTGWNQSRYSPGRSSQPTAAIRRPTIPRRRHHRWISTPRMHTCTALKSLICNTGAISPAS